MKHRIAIVMAGLMMLPDLQMYLDAAALFLAICAARLGVTWDLQTPFKALLACALIAGICGIVGLLQRLKGNWQWSPQLTRR